MGLRITILLSIGLVIGNAPPLGSLPTLWVVPADPPDAGESLRVIWQAEIGTLYELSKSEDLLDWSVVEGFPRTATEETEKHGFILLEGSRFFRLRIVEEGPPQPEGMVLLSEGWYYPFYIGVYEVTWSEWNAVVQWAAGRGYAWSGPDQHGFEPAGCGNNHPVHSVSWYDAVKWCNAKSEMEGLTPAYRVEGEVYRSGEFGSHGSGVVDWDTAANGYRLPTMSEWIFAASGGFPPDGFIYSGSNNADEVAWHSGNAANPLCDLFQGLGTHPVGLKLPNSLGLFDMSGNVYEWCWDADGNARTIKGGSWGQHESGARIDFYHGWSPDARFSFGGFRLVRHAGP